MILQDGSDLVKKKGKEERSLQIKSKEYKGGNELMWNSFAVCWAVGWPSTALSPHIVDDKAILDMFHFSRNSLKAICSTYLVTSFSRGSEQLRTHGLLRRTERKLAAFGRYGFTLSKSDLQSNFLLMRCKLM